MGFIDLHKPLMDLIPDDYKLCIDRDFGYTFLTLRHGDRIQCCRIRSVEKPTDKNLKAAIAFMVEQMTAKLDSLKKLKKAMDKIHADALNQDLSDEYQRGHALGLIHALKMIQESNMF